MIAGWVDPDQARARQLTKRHLDILTGIARGRSNAEIAAELFMGTSTAHRLRVELFARLNVSNAAQAVAFAYDYGILRTREVRVELAQAAGLRVAS